MGFYESVMPEFAGIQYDAETSGVMELTAENVKKIADQLLKGKDGLGTVKFEDITAKETDFGGSRSAKQLGYHHGLAHGVVADTIVGVMKDLQTFSDGLNQAVKDAEGADELSSEDMERLGRTVPTTYGEQARDDSQTTVLPPGTPGGDSDEGGDDESGDPPADNDGAPPAAGDDSDTPPAGSDENGEG